MKKIYYVLFITLFIACKQEKEERLAPPKATTLNGIPLDEANSMVQSFRANRLSSDSVTSIWFSKNFLDTMFSVIKTIPPTDTIDGVRFYYAKKFEKNAIVMLLTKNAGPSKTHPGMNIHEDYFLDRPQMNSIFMRGVDEYYEVTGADLYTTKPCPKAICPPDDFTVSCEMAKQWVTTFKVAQRRNAQKINTLSVWYPLALFTKLKELNKQATDRGEIGDGFRIYFVRNNNDRVNFILVPTIKAPNGIHQDDYNCLVNIFRDPNDRGEECPVFCDGMVWPCIPPDCD